MGACCVPVVDVRTYVLPSSEYQNHVYSPRDRTIFSVFRAHLSTIYPYPPWYDIERGQRTAMMYVYIKYTIFIIYVVHEETHRPQVYMSTYLSDKDGKDTANVSLIDRMNNNMMHDLQY